MNTFFGRLIQLSSVKNAPCLINYEPVRNRLWAKMRPILGWPRQHLAKINRKYPEPHIYNWRPYLPEDQDYTIRPLPILKMGGRDLEDGRVVVRTLGGGNKKKFRWVDMHRTRDEDNNVQEERVLQLRYDPLHTPKLALVANEDRARWIFATDGIQVGDIIRTFSELPRNPVRAKIGDAYPIGALPTGTKVHMVEIKPGEGAKFCISAGSSAEVIKRSSDSVTLKLAYGDTVKIDRFCMAVVGQLSNVEHQHVELWCPQRKRWLGKRPRSGLWHRKDGYCGRKPHKPKLLDLTNAAMLEKEKSKKDNSYIEFDG